ATVPGPQRTSHGWSDAAGTYAAGVGTTLVAIPGYRLALSRVSGWTAGRFAIPDRYVSALQRAGLRPCILTSPDPAPASEILDPFAGLLLVGGGDVEPGRYGDGAHT